MPEYDPVAKISILPRGGAGGLTFFAPSEERLESGLYSRSYLENQMAVALGGRIAEELIWGENGITTGRQAWRCVVAELLVVCSFCCLSMAVASQPERLPGTWLFRKWFLTDSERLFQVCLRVTSTQYCAAIRPQG